MALIMTENQRITIRNWTNGKKLLTSSDQRIKGSWLRAEAHAPGTIELLTDPDILPEPEDFDGPLSIVVDPKTVDIVYSLANDELGLLIRPEVTGDAGTGN